MKKHIDVCAAVARRGERYLAVQRRQGGEHPLKWEFPGGKIEPGETAEEALVREIREELDVAVVPIRPLAAVECEHEDCAITLRGFVCSMEGEPTLLEHLAAVWLEPGDLPKLDWSEADRGIVRQILEKQAL